MAAAQPSGYQSRNPGIPPSSSITASVTTDATPNATHESPSHSHTTSQNGKTGIILFTEDLRLHDNPTLHAAVNNTQTLIPLYCFDPCKVHSKDAFKPLKQPTARFLIDSIWDLRISLQSRRSNLIVRHGPLEQVLLQLCDSHNVRSIFFTRLERQSEYVIDRHLRKALRKKDIVVTAVPRSTLYKEEDLPFSFTQLEISWPFFVENIGDTVIRNPLPVPTEIPPLPQHVPLSPGEIPTMSELGFSVAIPFGSHRFQDVPGGETQALQILSLHPKLVSNSPYGVSLEPKFRSLFLEGVWIGCLSPRRIFEEVRKSVPFETAKKTIIFWYLLYIDYITFLLAEMSRDSWEPEKNQKKRNWSGNCVLKHGGGPFRTFERL